MTEHTCHIPRGLSPAQATDLCPRCAELAAAKG